MIVVQVADPYLRRAVCRAAHPEEDVVLEPELAVDAIERGYPRLVVREAGGRYSPVPMGTQLLEIDEATVRRWEQERRAIELPPTRLDHTTARLGTLIQRAGRERTAADRALADLTRASGARLPLPLRAFGRRILEFPLHYPTLRPVADACAMSRGALKAKFRRRGLASPYTYLRWFRIMSVADLLSDRSITVAVAAQRLGFTSDGNMCRSMLSLTGMTPTEVRSLPGWNRLLVTFAWTHLSPDALEAWASLDELFERQVA